MVGFAEQDARERSEKTQESLWLLVAKVGVPLMIMFAPFDYYYIQSLWPKSLVLRFGSILLVPLAYYFKTSKLGFVGIQWFALSIIFIFAGILNVLIFLCDPNVRTFYSIGLYMICVGVTVLIPWRLRFFFLVPLGVFGPFVSWLILDSDSRMEYIAANVANISGLLVLLYMIWRQNETLRSSDLNNRLMLAAELRNREHVITFQAKRLTEEAMRLQRNEMERELDVTVGRMSRQIAHDLKSPLTALKVLLRKVRVGSDEKALIEQSISRLERVLGGVEAISLSRREDLKAGAERASQHFIITLLRGVISEKQLEYSEIKAEVLLEIDPSLENILICVNELEFYRVISNVVNNAREAMSGRAGGIRIRAYMIAEGKICISIEDDGIGIPEDRLDEIFEKGISYKKVEGTGLGLSYVKETVTAWGGTVEISSKVNVGTTVKLAIPTLGIRMV